MTWVLVINVLGGVDQINCFGQISFPFTKVVKTGQLLEALALSVASNTPPLKGLQGSSRAINILPTYPWQIDIQQMANGKMNLWFWFIYFFLWSLNQL